MATNNAQSIMLYHYKTAKIFDLIPYARNARAHSDEQVAQIAASIREFSFINPVIVDGDRGIVAGHGTQKPVECMKRPIENNSLPGQAVYEPFSGSGTTIIAAEITRRFCHAIELNPAYVDVALQRSQKFTGQEAVLDGDGRSFADVKARRQPVTEAA